MCVRLWRVRYFHLLVYFGWLLLVLLLFLFIFSAVCACVCANVSFRLYWCADGLSSTCHHIHNTLPLGTHWLSLFGLFYSLIEIDVFIYMCVYATNYICIVVAVAATAAVVVVVASTSYVRLLVRSLVRFVQFVSMARMHTHTDKLI